MHTLLIYIISTGYRMQLFLAQKLVHLGIFSDSCRFSAKYTLTPQSEGAEHHKDSVSLISPLIDFLDPPISLSWFALSG